MESEKIKNRIDIPEVYENFKISSWTKDRASLLRKEQKDRLNEVRLRREYD